MRNDIAMFDQETSLDDRLCALAEWHDRATSHLSNLTLIADHPAYRAIVEIGEPAIPFLLRGLKNRSGLWFQALHEITGEQPVAPEIAGRYDEMAKAWLAWGATHGFSAP